MPDVPPLLIDEPSAGWTLTRDDVGDIDEFLGQSADAVSPIFAPNPLSLGAALTETM